MLGSLREPDLSQNGVHTLLMAGGLQPLLGRLTILGLIDLLYYSEEGARGLLSELHGSGADMREFRFSMFKRCAGAASDVQHCLRTWPQPRVPLLKWPAQTTLSVLLGKDMDVHASGLQELELHCVYDMEVEYSVSKLLHLLTKGGDRHRGVLLAGECALGAWLAEMPAVQVLQVRDMRAGCYSAHFTQPGRMFEKLTALTGLRELRVSSHAKFSIAVWTTMRRCRTCSR